MRMAAELEQRLPPLLDEDHDDDAEDDAWDESRGGKWWWVWGAGCRRRKTDEGKSECHLRSDGSLVEG